jgi:hypothetical protein
VQQSAAFRERRSVLEASSRAWYEGACVQHASWLVQIAPDRDATVGPQHAELALFLFL